LRTLALSLLNEFANGIPRLSSERSLTWSLVLFAASTTSRPIGPRAWTWRSGEATIWTGSVTGQCAPNHGKSHG
jgi:hypothetical protein